MASIYTFENRADAVRTWLEFKRLNKMPHSIYWHEGNKCWAFWIY